MTVLSRCLAVVLGPLLLSACGSGPEVRYGVEGGEWRSYAGDPGSSKYSPLDQVHAGNFDQLRVAWRWRSADVDRRKGKKGWAATVIHDFQNTPLMVGGRIYGITTAGIVYALEASTGQQLWLSDPGRVTSSVTHRGVTYWREGADERIFVATRDAWLAAIDAKTGRTIYSFGEEGRVDLLQGLRHTGPIQRSAAKYTHTSPVALHRNTLIVGSTIPDRPQRRRAIPGDVRGYDARTGELRWVFHTIPAEGEPGTEAWEDEAWRYTGAANAWGPMSVDRDLGTVYVTTSTPTNDYYGGHRLGDNLFAETLLCLDAESGERIWHFQLVHHGLWDYDPGAAANLVDIEVAGRSIQAVAQVTKQAFVFVFDRKTGEPVWPIEERPVPTSDVPGEQTSPTQPFPTKPPPFDRQGTFEEDLIDFTPELRAEALALFRRFRTGPLFTPPSIEGSLVLPGPNGGSNWMGAGFDPETGMLYVPSITEANVLSVKAGDPERTDFHYLTDLSMAASIPRGRWLHMGGLRPFKPPYSRITAFDLNEGEIVWQVANGNGPRDHPRLAHLDLPPLGSGGHACVLVTGSLLFVADGGAGRWSPYGEPLLRAYDKATGAVVGEIELPAKVRGCPMTYLHENAQFLVMPIGDRDHDPELIALALPGAVQRP
jgi:quinoprotein glucose dehydrogenase